MRYFLLPFLLSSFFVFLLLRIFGSAERWKLHVNGQSPQHSHTVPIPRIGGLGVAMAALGGLALIDAVGPKREGPQWALYVCALGAFAVGFTEDLTGWVSVRTRLFFVALAALAATFVPGVTLLHTDLPPFDWLIALPMGAVALTVFTITGITNAFNIIDGLNGLSSMCAILILAAIAYAGFEVGDFWVAKVAIVMAGSLAGFFIWNFPAGYIFLGDGGAYFSGFFVAALGLLLIARNANIATIYPLLLCIYPVSETVFSMYRRSRRKRAIGGPDRAHLHSLMYRRLRPRLLGARFGDHPRRRNSITSPYLWALCLGSVVPAVLFYDDFRVLAVFLMLFIVGYVALYRRIVRFKTPRWL